MQKYLNEKRNRNNPCLKDITPRLISRNKCSQSVKKFDQPTLIKYKKYNDNTPPASSPFYITKK